MQWIICLLVLGWFTGCGGRALETAKERAAHDLLDPASAQFRDVRAGATGVVCGEINGKNRMGAYVGFRRFMVSDSLGVEMDGDDLTINPARWRLWCDPRSITSSHVRDSLLAKSREIDSLVGALDSLLTPLLNGSLETQSGRTRRAR